LAIFEVPLKYFQVDDFSCSILPDNHFDYMFSFGCLCHVSLEGITAYAQNLFGKLKPGANCFWMIADYAQLNASGKLVNENRQRLVDHLLPYSRETLENPGHPRENDPVIAGADWVHGQQAARIWRLRAGHG